MVHSFFPSYYNQEIEYGEKCNTLFLHAYVGAKEWGYTLFSYPYGAVK